MCTGMSPVEPHDIVALRPARHCRKHWMQDHGYCSGWDSSPTK